MSRARSKIDGNKLSAMVSRPGIDPRINLSFAVVTDVAFDGKHGMFADVALVPTGETMTALVGVSYAGARFGSWEPVEVDDIVLVALPVGDPSYGAVIVSRFYRSSDLPPDELKGTTGVDGDVADPTPNVVLRVKPGAKYILRTSGDTGDVDVKVEGNGAVRIEAAGSGDVHVKQSGSGNVFVFAAGKVYAGVDDTTSGSQPVALGQTLATFLASVQGYLDAHVHTPGTFANSGGPVVGASGPPNPSPSPPDVRAVKVEVK